MFNPIQNDTLIQIIRRGCQLLTRRTEENVTNPPCPPTPCIRTACADSPFTSNACAPTSCTAYKGMYDPATARTDVSTSTESKAHAYCKGSNSKSTCSACQTNQNRAVSGSLPRASRSNPRIKDCGCPVNASSTEASRSRSVVSSAKVTPTCGCVSNDQTKVSSPDFCADNSSLVSSCNPTVLPESASKISSVQTTQSRNVSGNFSVNSRTSQRIINENGPPPCPIAASKQSCAPPNRYVHENFLNLAKSSQKLTNNGPPSCPKAAALSTSIRVVSPPVSKDSPQNSCIKSTPKICDPCASILKPPFERHKYKPEQKKIDPPIFLPGQTVDNRPALINVMYAPKSLDEDLPDNIEFLLEAERRKQLEPPCPPPAPEPAPAPAPAPAPEPVPETSEKPEIKSNLKKQIKKTSSNTKSCSSKVNIKVTVQDTKSQTSTCVSRTASKTSQTKVIPDKKASKTSTCSTKVKLPPENKSSKAKPKRGLSKTKLTATAVHTIVVQPCKQDKTCDCGAQKDQKDEKKTSPEASQTRSRKKMHDSGNSPFRTPPSSRSPSPLPPVKTVDANDPSAASTKESQKSIKKMNVKIKTCVCNQKTGCTCKKAASHKNIKVTISNTSSKSSAQPEIKVVVYGSPSKVSRKDDKLSSSSKGSCQQNEQSTQKHEQPVQKIKKPIQKNEHTIIKIKPSIQKYEKPVQKHERENPVKDPCGRYLIKVNKSISKCCTLKKAVSKSPSRKKIKKTISTIPNAHDDAIADDAIADEAVPDDANNTDETEPTREISENQCDEEPDYSKMDPPDLFREEAEQYAVRCKDGFKEVAINSDSPFQRGITKILQATVSDTANAANSLQTPSANCPCLLKPPTCPCRGFVSKELSQTIDKSVETAVDSGSVPGTSNSKSKSFSKIKISGEKMIVSNLAVANSFKTGESRELSKISYPANGADSLKTPSANCPCLLKPPTCPCRGFVSKELSQTIKKSVETAVDSGSIAGTSNSKSKSFSKMKISGEKTIVSNSAVANTLKPGESRELSKISYRNRSAGYQQIIKEKVEEEAEPEPEPEPVTEAELSQDISIKPVEKITCPKERKPRRYPLSSTRLLSNPCILFRRPPAQSTSLHKRRSFVPDCPFKQEGRFPDPCRRFMPPELPEPPLPPEPVECSCEPEPEPEPEPEFCEYCEIEPPLPEPCSCELEPLQPELETEKETENEPEKEPEKEPEIEPENEPEKEPEIEPELSEAITLANASGKCNATKPRLSSSSPPKRKSVEAKSFSNERRSSKKSKHDLNRKKAGCEDAYESSSSFGSEFSYPNFKYGQSNTLRDFIACLNVSKFKPDEIQAKIINDSIFVEGSHDERLEDNGIVARTFTRKYILPKDYDPNKVEVTMYKDKILKIKVPAPMNQISRMIPIHLRKENATIKANAVQV